MKSTVKIVAVALYYLVLTLLFSFIFNCFYMMLQNEVINTNVFSITFSSFLIFILWKNIYSFNFHYYLEHLKTTITKSIVWSLIFTLILDYLYFSFIEKSFMISHLRFDFLIYIVGVVSFVALFHKLQFLWIKSLGNLGYFHRKVLVVGDLNDVELGHHFKDNWNSREYSGNLILSDDDIYFGKNKYNNEKISSYKDLIYKENIGEVIFFIDNTSHTLDSISEIKSFLKSNGITYTVYKNGNKKIRNFITNKEFIVESFDVFRNSLKAITVKRLISIILSLSCIILGFPIWLLLGILIKSYDGGSIFYVSKRVGKNGKVFNFYKFRTMVMDAEKQKKKLLKFNMRNDGPLFKMKDDPRITPIGKILRKFSLDEFPQMINILKGEMCFIGPRPHLPSEVESYSPRDYLRLECIPGLSCLPQLLGRNSIGFRDWVELDLEYRLKWNFAMDIKIFVKTIFIVISPLFTKNGGD